MASATASLPKSIRVSPDITDHEMHRGSGSGKIVLLTKSCSGPEAFPGAGMAQRGFVWFCTCFGSPCRSFARCGSGDAGCRRAVAGAGGQGDRSDNPLCRVPCGQPRSGSDRAPGGNVDRSTGVAHFVLSSAPASRSPMCQVRNILLPQDFAQGIPACREPVVTMMRP